MSRCNIPKGPEAPCKLVNKDIRDEPMVKQILSREKIVASIFKKYPVINLSTGLYDRTGKDLYDTWIPFPEVVIKFTYKVEYELPNGFIQTYCFNA